MKKDKELQKEIAAVRGGLGEGPALPESLSPENVVAAVSGKKQRAPVKKTLRRAVSLAVAACIAITVTVFWRTSVYAPQIRADAASYQEVGRLMKEYARSQAASRFLKSGFSLRYNGFLKATDEAVAAYGDLPAGAPESSARTDGMAAEESAAASAFTNTTGDDYGKTNVREQGVAEQDVLQTDGRYLYLLAGGADFLILDPADALREVSRLDPTEGAALAEDTDYENGVTESYGGFYLVGNLVIFTGERWEYHANGCDVKTCVKVFDITDPAAPVRVRSLQFDGNLAASRFVNGRMLVVTQYYPEREAVVYNDYTTYIPKTTDGDDTCYLPEDSICLGSVDEADCFLTVSSFEPAGEPAALEQTGVFGGGAEVYCTTDTLYVYRSCWSERFFFTGAGGGWNCATNVMAFDIGGDKPAFLAKGSVEGTLLNSFSIDAYGGNLRLATTVSGERNGEWTTENRVWVLNENLEEIGRSAVFGEGESVYGVRFSGDTGYIVTFYQTDPLFVMDLSDPANPVMRGELKLPGFSSYLHPVGNGLLLGLGRGGDDDGLDGSAKATLFDVSDPLQPKEAGSVTFADAWFHNDYKAFVDMGDGTYLIPYSRWEETAYQPEEPADPADDTEYYPFRQTSFAGALRLGVADGTLSERGRYDYANETGTTPRVTFIGGRVYVVDRLDWWDGVCAVYTFDRDGYTQIGDPVELTLSNAGRGGMVVCY